MEQRAHNEDRGDNYDRVQGYGPTHHDGVNHVRFYLVDSDGRKEHPHHENRIYSQSQNHLRDKRDKRPYQRYEGQDPAQGSFEKRVWYPDYVEGYRSECPYYHHRA